MDQWAPGMSDGGQSSEKFCPSYMYIYSVFDQKPTYSNHYIFISGIKNFIWEGVEGVRPLTGGRVPPALPFLELSLAIGIW